MATAPQPLMTAEEFGRRPDPGHPEELVRGRVVRVPPPRARHGQVCARAVRLLGAFVDAGDLGHVLSNDTGVLTERDPDTLRGADVSFYSYARVPRGPLPEAYIDAPPDLVVEVLSPDDRWPRALAKVAEYLNAGVAVVLVLDPARRSVHVYQAEEPVRVFGPEDEVPLVLDGREVGRIAVRDLLP